MTERSRRGVRTLVTAALLGSVAALSLVPRARTTVAAQVELALGRRPEWLRATGLGRGLEPRLQRVLAAAPQDVELQIGATTLPYARAVDTNAPMFAGTGSQGIRTRLEDLARRFPDHAAIRAHQARQLTGRMVLIQRGEFNDFAHPRRAASRSTTRLPEPEGVRSFETAANAGRRLEPENGFFDSMLAVSGFATGRDAEALRSLRAAAKKPRWDDHAVEEPRAQWRLLQSAYGNHGALQEIRTAVNLLLPHFAQLRNAARMAVWHAEWRKLGGDHEEAIAIRRDVMKLGLRIMDESPLWIGKSVGADVFQTGTRPLRLDLERERSVSWEVARKARRDAYADYLQAHSLPAEAAWVRAQGRRADETWARMHRAQEAGGSMSLFPPEGLLGWWTLGLVLIRQMMALLVLWGVAVLLARLSSGARAGMGSVPLSVLLLLTPVVLITVIGSIPLAWENLDVGLAVRLFGAMLVLWGTALAWRRLGGRHSGEAGVPSAGAWIAVLLALFLAPFVLAGMMEPMLPVWGSLAVGLALLGLLGLTRWLARRGVPIEGRQRWQPALVALVTVLPTTVWLFLARNSFAKEIGFAERILGINPIFEYTQEPARILPVLILLPSALLAFLLLCRVSALGVPLLTGWSRGIRRTAPLAIALLLAVYLAALVPTVAVDRALDSRFNQAVLDETSYLTERP